LEGAGISSDARSKGQHGLSSKGRGRYRESEGPRATHAFEDHPGEGRRDCLLGSCNARSSASFIFRSQKSLWPIANSIWSGMKKGGSLLPAIRHSPYTRIPNERRVTRDVSRNSGRHAQGRLSILPPKRKQMHSGCSGEERLPTDFILPHNVRLQDLTPFPALFSTPRNKASNVVKWACADLNRGWNNGSYFI
jgi:hypothetical protein